ncbi:cytoplasmic protein [Ochrobactrum sp. CM-21-5]|nr:cytoplasmic protein [Ochrobactrum sp. CM-21-5]MBC2884714.1 cytoplasmic protein [Ochrobactrum sp. CM-21-5]
MNTSSLESARTAFLAARTQDRLNAMQRIALRMIAGMDMDELMIASDAEKQRASCRLERLIERERLKGVSGHWSYDLNRHIALKQSLDMLTRSTRGRTQTHRKHEA